MNWSRERVDAMLRYAESDRSDPFTLARCKAHMRNGICGFRPMTDAMPWVNENDPRRMGNIRPASDDAFYGATEHTEMRTIEQGDIKLTFPVIVYRNVVRP